MKQGAIGCGLKIQSGRCNRRCRSSNQDYIEVLGDLIEGFLPATWLDIPLRPFLSLDPWVLRVSFF
jgi:hypothetical protein